MVKPPAPRALSGPTRTCGEAVVRGVSLVWNAPSMNRPVMPGCPEWLQCPPQGFFWTFLIEASRRHSFKITALRRQTLAGGGVSRRGMRGECGVPSRFYAVS